MKNRFISIIVAAVLTTTAVFNVMAATEEADPVVATATEKKSDNIKVKLNKDKVKKTTGSSFKLKANVNKKGFKPKFYSTNKKVATVTSDGVVKTKKAGTANIVANCNGVKDTCKVNVVKKGNSISNTTMSKIADKVGCQLDGAYYSSKIMCSAYSFAYAYKQVKGKYITPGSVWSSGGCTWNGGTYSRYSSATQMLKAIKSEIDNNRACVGLMSNGSNTHYVTFYNYTGKGTTISDFVVLDPWDGKVKNASEFYYSSYHVVTID